MSVQIQNELLDSINEVHIDHLKAAIQGSIFVSVKADETTDISCQSQFVVVLPFIENGVPEENFLKFVNVSDRTARGFT